MPKMPDAMFLLFGGIPPTEDDLDATPGDGAPLDASAPAVEPPATPRVSTPERERGREEIPRPRRPFSQDQLRRPAEPSDEELTLRVRAALSRDPLLDGLTCDVMIVTRLREVTLFGVLSSSAARDAFERRARGVEGVRRVSNRICLRN